MIRSPGPVIPVAASAAIAPVLQSRPSSAIVRAVSHNVWVMVVDGPSPWTRLVTVVSHGGVHHPAAVVLPRSARPLAVCAGDKITIGDGGIAVAGTRLQVARWWNPRVRLRHGRPRGRSLRMSRRSARLREYLDGALVGGARAGGARGGAGGAVSGVADTGGSDVGVLHRIVAVASSLTTSGVGGTFEDVVGRLVGFGPGTTPAGDDLLAGIIATLAAIDHPARWPLAGAVERQLAAGKTTLVSAALLHHATNADVADEARGVIRWVIDANHGSDTLPRGELGRLLGLGASSGWALAYGIAMADQVAHAVRDALVADSARTLTSGTVVSPQQEMMSL